MCGDDLHIQMRPHKRQKLKKTYNLIKNWDNKQDMVLFMIMRTKNQAEIVRVRISNKVLISDLYNDM